MKSFRILLVAAVSLVTAGGCKNFLTEEVRADYPETAFYQTQSHALLALTAAYQMASFQTDQNRLWVFGDVASDDADEGGNPGDQADIGFLDDFTIYPNGGPIEAQWAQFYEGVNRCNLVLQKVPPIAMDEALKARILGEARFLRAYYYFTLVNIYGPIPLILEPKNANELQIRQSPVSDIYQNAIEKDCQAAIAALPASYAGADVGRATKGAATALLAKAYLYQQKWQQAAETAAQVTTVGGYKLLPVFSQNFNQEFKNSTEAVFSVQHLTNQVPFLGNRLNQWFAPRTENGYFFDVPTAGFVNEFEKTATGVVDPRLDYTVAREGQPWFDGVPFDPTWSPTGYLQRKNVQPISEVPVNRKGDGNLSYVAIRFADVLLWQAEALNELGKSAEALTYLNQVRKRARESYLNDPTLRGTVPAVPTGLLPDVTTTSQSTLRDLIRHERRVELGFEFHRYFDLMRWGKAYAQAALSDKKNFNYEQNRYFPIPQSERDTNKALTF